MTKTTMPNKTIARLFNDRKVRIESTKKDILLFFNFYFTKYIKYKTARFQIEILKLLQDSSNKTIVITAFRNSAKSTFCSLVLPIWSIVGVHQKKNVLIVCQTEEKAQQTLINIRKELESNLMLLSDHGTFYSGNDEWNKRTLVISKYGARITIVSVSESVRGVRHEEHRPDLIVYDDIEDVRSAKTQESRDSLWGTITREFIPLGNKDTRNVFIGNLVSLDSTIVRLRDLIERKEMKGVYREYPLIKNDKILWPGMFPNMEAIEEFKKQQPSEIDFLREYMLKIIPDGDRLIFPENIKRYTQKELDVRADFQMYLISIDPAVSGKHAEKNDKTAIIIFKVYGSGKKMKYYIQENPINNRFEWPETLVEVGRIVESLGPYPSYKIIIEGGSTQKGLAQALNYEGFNAIEVTPQGNDKRTRVSMLKNWLSNKIFFPESGTKELETQLFTFGVERYDDLVDALTLVVLAMPKIEKGFSSCIAVRSTEMYKPVKLSKYGDIKRLDDWADKDDESIFRKYKMKDPQRILE
jgi:predicted phage terminase large subunit-like protein